MSAALEFTVDAAAEAHEPPEARGLTRDGVRLLVGRRGTGEVSHHRFTELPALLEPGDVLVVNTSATLPAAVPIIGQRLGLHFSTELSDGAWLVELRDTAGKASQPYDCGAVGQEYALPGGARVTIRAPYSQGRLWIADVHIGASGYTPVEYLHRFGAPIRYGYVPRPWPLSAYQTVFATEPGSAEMPSAGRPFTEHLVTRLVAMGVQFAPIVLHTGVASA